MRFRGKMRVDEFSNFYSVLLTMARLGKVCVLNIEPTAVRICAVSDDDGLQPYASLRPDLLFGDYRVESRNHNRIGLQMNMGNLVKAFRSASTQALSITVRLTKKALNPYLTVDILTQNSVSITQDVPVIVMAPDEMEGYAEPSIPAAEVRLSMADCKAMRSVVDRMKGLSKFLTIEADMRGSLVLRAENDTVTMKTFIRNLTPEMMTEEESKDPARAVVRLDLPQLSKLLASQKSLSARIVCCVAGSTAFIFHLILASGLGSITYYMPVIVSDDDRELFATHAATPMPPHPVAATQSTMAGTQRSVLRSPQLPHRTQPSSSGPIARSRIDHGRGEPRPAALRATSASDYPTATSASAVASPEFA